MGGSAVTFSLHLSVRGYFLWLKIHQETLEAIELKARLIASIVQPNANVFSSWSSCLHPDALDPTRRVELDDYTPFIRSVRGRDVSPGCAIITRLEHLEVMYFIGEEEVKHNSVHELGLEKRDRHDRPMSWIGGVAFMFVSLPNYCAERYGKRWLIILFARHADSTFDGEEVDKCVPRGLCTLLSKSRRHALTTGVRRDCCCTHLRLLLRRH